METLIQDLRYSMRTLRRSPGFTAVAVLTLTVGIGANSAIFSAVEVLLVRPLPYRDASRVAFIQETRAVTGLPSSVSPLNYLDWRSQSDTFDAMAAVTFGAATMTAGDATVPVRGQRVSADYFRVFGLTPLLGRGFRTGNNAPGAAKVAIVSHHLWSERFGSDRAVVGRAIRIDGELFTIVGVMPTSATVDFFRTELWTPLSWNARTLNRDFHSVSFAVVKLKTGVSLAAAQSQMDTIARRISRDHPATNKGWGALVRPYADLWITTDFRRSLYLLLIAVAAVLLIGCANLSNMTLARGLAREREVMVRSALGASRLRLVRQQLTENLVIAAIGGALGVGLARVLLRVLLRSVAAYEMPYDLPISIDGRVLTFTGALSIACAITFGLVPSFSATRTASGQGLRAAGRNATIGRTGRSWRSALIVSEVALAVALLSSAGLLVRSFYRMQHTDPGFVTTNILTAALPIADAQFPDRVQMNAYLERIVARVQSLPGVERVALTDALPMHWPPYGTFFQVVGRPAVERANRPLCDLKTVSPSYFSTVGLVRRRGRLLNDEDRPGFPLATVINETMARRYFPREDPLGHRLLMRQIVAGPTAQFGPDVSWEIVGVIADERFTPFNDPTERPAMYVSYRQSPTPFQLLVVGSSVDAASMTEPVRKAVAEINREQALSDVMTLEQVMAESESPDRLRTTLIGTFALAATFLSAIGVYGVIAFSVGQRTREIGIRRALGATVANLQWLVGRDVVGLTGVGAVLGIGASIGLSRFLAGFLFGISATDPSTIAGTTCLIAGLCAAAAYLPTRRVVGVDPIEALRAE
jgi:putative ABC transport system permease protein